MQRTMPNQILLVDDDPALRTILSLELEQCGYSVLAFPSVEAVIGQPLHTPTIVILDYQLPGLTGLALLKHLRTHQPDLPALIITAHPNVSGDPDWPQNAHTELLHKPFRAERFLSVVAELLHKNRTYPRC
jgi:DNA-binding NtrC family response regulator